MEQVIIETTSKEYPLFIGEGIRHEMSKLLEKNYTSILVITDDHVAPLYLDDVLTALSTHQSVYHYVVCSGEQAKSFEVYYDLQTYALEVGLDRKSLIIALGGGVIGDLAGFVAATYMRGISFVQVPTTLLAHDSSVGGKVAINHPLGKNMIGAFHQPDAVIYDVETLKTLPKEELRSGFAEVIKHALIWNRSFYEDLKAQISSLNDLKGQTMIQVLKRAIEVKAAVVKKDETEQGIRAFLNFGHTLAHALEAELGYGKITHGDAVACGMIYAMKVSEHVFKRSYPIDEIEAWFKMYHFPTVIPRQLSAEKLLKRMKKDKKSMEGQVKMVLLDQIGQVSVHVVEDQLLLDIIGEMR